MTDAATPDAMSGSEAVAPSAGADQARDQTRRTQKVGRVVSDKMEKTIVVAVDSVRRHPLYRKRMRRTSKFLAHDEENRCRPGDVVRIEETRPLSKRKRWVVREIIEQGVRV